MSDLISRDDAITVLRIISDKMDKSGSVVMDQAISIIKAVPTTHERPVGEWVEIRPCAIECSICQARMTILDCDNPNYCPVCGTKMRVKK